MSRSDTTAFIARALGATALAAWCLDDDRTIRFVNEAAAALTGHIPDELIGRRIDGLWPDDRRREYSGLLDEALEGRTDHHEIEFLCADGSVAPVGISWSVVRDDEDRVTGFVGIGRDITERKEVEHALRRGADSFRRLVDRSEEGMFLVSLGSERRLTYLNPALERSIGYSLADFRQDPELWRERIHPDDRAELLAQVNETEMRQPLHFRWAHPDGDWVELTLRELLVIDTADVPDTLVGIVHDVTADERRRSALESALGRERQATQRLRRIDEVRQTFLQAVSHELRTPLTSVVGFARTLEDRQDQLSEDQVAAMLRRIVRNANRLQDLLDDLLDVDRLSRGVLYLEREPTDLRDLVRRVVDHVVPSADWVEVDAESLILNVDQRKVERIVENLLRNAIKHAGEHVRIRLEVRGEDEYAVIVVADNGIGIPDEYKRIVFEPFERGPAVARGTPGTGIGLTLVRELARLHGGDVTVEDAEGGGAVVTVRLPIPTSGDRTGNDDGPDRRPAA